MRDKAVAYYVYYKNWKGWFSGGTYYRNDEKEAFKDAIAGMSSYDTTIIGIDVRRRPLSPAKPKRVDRPGKYAIAWKVFAEWLRMPEIKPTFYYWLENRVEDERQYCLTRV